MAAAPHLSFAAAAAWECAAVAAVKEAGIIMEVRLRDMPSACVPRAGGGVDSASISWATTSSSSGVSSRLAGALPAGVPAQQAGPGLQAECTRLGRNSQGKVTCGGGEVVGSLLLRPPRDSAVQHCTAG